MSDERTYGPTKAERALQRAREIEDELPPVDIGQFTGVAPPSSSPYTPDQVIRACASVVKGATLRDAEVLAGMRRGSLRAWQRDSLRAERGQHPPLGPWAGACAYTVERALALRRVRWQALAEEGGKGSSAALWMLDRRGGKEYAAPAQRHEVRRESQEVVVHATIDQALEATATQLGLDRDELRASGDYWARAITASQRGDALPAPVTVDAHVVEDGDG